MAGWLRSPAEATWALINDNLDNQDTVDALIMASVPLSAPVTVCKVPNGSVVSPQTDCTALQLRLLGSSKTA